MTESCVDEKCFAVVSVQANRSPRSVRNCSVIQCHNR